MLTGRTLRRCAAQRLWPCASRGLGRPRAAHDWAALRRALLELRGAPAAGPEDDVLIDAVGQTLAACRADSGPLLDAAGLADVPLNLASGYAVQHAATRALEAREGWQAVGFKAGATGKQVQDRMKLKVPFMAPLHAATTLVAVPAGLTSSAGPLPALRRVRGVEAEWGFVLGAELAPLAPGQAPYTRDHVAASVAHVVPCIEVTSTRFTEPAGTPLSVADGGGGGLIVAATREAWRTPSDWECTDAPAIKVTTFVDGVAQVTGTGAEVLGHPLNSLLWLANSRDRVVPLRAGDLISSGAANGMLPLQTLPAHVAVEFEGWARLELNLGGENEGAACQQYLPLPTYLAHWAHSRGDHPAER